MSAGTTQTDIPDVLRKIVERRAEALSEARGRETFTEPPRQEIFQTAAVNPFVASIEQRRGRAIIAEVKMGSPSLGSLEGRFDPEEQARAYADAGAAALSVVVEPDFFHGSYELLERCVRASELPAIAKDFVVDPLQLRWARRAGACAILLIASLYTPQELRAYARLARRHGLVPLIETHEAADVAKLEQTAWEAVGVNARDLRNFTVDLGGPIGLAPTLPRGALKIAESGIHTADDRRRLEDAGFDAFLIGESLLVADDPAAKLRELIA